MNRSQFGRCLLGGAAFVVAGCGGSQPFNATGALSQSPMVITSAGSWMLPEAKSEDLLYVSNWSANSVTIYSYKDRKLVGTLTDFDEPNGVCADRAGNVFVINSGSASVVEYTHGGTTPIHTFKDPGSNAEPWDCSVDPTTGDLAVANVFAYRGNGDLVVFTSASTPPKVYTDGSYLLNFYFCTYDNQGNLFVDGISEGSPYRLALAELRRGADALTNLQLKPRSGPYSHAFGVMWDGKHLTLARSGNDVYRLKIEGKQAVDHGLTVLKNGFLEQYWFGPPLQGQTQVGISTDNIHNVVYYWKYPSGGAPLARITNGLDNPNGVTVSLAPRK